MVFSVTYYSELRCANEKICCPAAQNTFFCPLCKECFNFGSKSNHQNTQLWTNFQFSQTFTNIQMHPPKIAKHPIVYS